MHNQNIACSDCFKDFGVKAQASLLGSASPEACPVCHLTTGRKLTKELLEDVCQTYFVHGTIPNGRGIFAPLIQFNNLREEFELAPFSTPSVNEDVAMLARVHKIYCFLYGPPLWQFGKPCDENGNVSWNESDFDYIIKNCSALVLDQQDIFYRLQTNVREQDLIDFRFCSPPDSIRKFQRFDSKELPILYAARDIETCLHENRTTLQDECFVAVLSPKRKLKILDLSQCKTPSDVTPFEDPNIWLMALLYDGGGAYDICRRLANRIRDKGYDGFIYTSYFQQAAKRTHQNVAVFGRPVVAGDLAVRSLQKVRLNSVAYDWQFASIVKGAYIESSDASSRGFFWARVQQLIDWIRQAFIQRNHA